MRCGVSTSSLFPMLTEEALEHLLALEIRLVEVFLNSPSERTPAFAKMLRKRADACGARILSVHPYTSEHEGIAFFSQYPRRFEDEAEEYRRFFDFCGIVGAKLFVFHGARSFLPIEPSLYFERFERLREIAASQDVILCQENVARCHCNQPDFVRAMKKQLPEASFVCDLKQALRAKVDPFEMLDAMGKQLVHLHLSDFRDDCDCVPPSMGDFDFARLAALLKAQEFEGGAMVELYRWSYDVEHRLKESVDFLQSL